MRLVILTTQTPHHAYFVREIAREFPTELILNEITPLTAPFEVAHPFETERDIYEQKIWFSGGNPSLAEASGSEMRPFASINDPEAIECLKTASPDVVVVFGTGLLRPPVIATCPNGMINLHGGDPEGYRGLDTHLWAIYHGAFDDLITTLHHVDPELDNGDIIEKMNIPVSPGMKLHELRRANTEICVELTKNALRTYQETGKFASVPQTEKGRMYSFMPEVLKDLCVRRFEFHTSRIS
jgi:methionyl-tRNA formyltransferase